MGSYFTDHRCASLYRTDDTQFLSSERLGVGGPSNPRHHMFGSTLPLAKVIDFRNLKLVVKLYEI